EPGALRTAEQHLCAGQEGPHRGVVHEMAILLEQGLLVVALRDVEPIPEGALGPLDREGGNEPHQPPCHRLVYTAGEPPRTGPPEGDTRPGAPGGGRRFSPAWSRGVVWVERP